jgi:hypothetical protein
MMVNHAYCREEIAELFIEAPKGKLETFLWIALLVQCKGSTCTVHFPFWRKIFKATEI